MALVGFSIVFTLLGLNLFAGIEKIIVFAAIGCLAICAFASKWKLRGKAAATLLCIICACAIFSYNEQYNYREAVSFAGDRVTVSAQIVSLPRKSASGWFYTLETREIDGVSAEHKVDLFSPVLLEAEPYDMLEFVGGLSASDSEYGNKADGIFLQSFWQADVRVIESDSKPIGYYLLEAKQYVRQRLYSLMPQSEASLAVGMMTGDKDGIDKASRDDFRRAGLSHVLAVSGLHMSIVVMGLYKLLLMLVGRFTWIASAVGIAVSLLYTGVSGFSMSAVRSCVMICVLLFGDAISRQADSLNSMGIAAFLIALHNPYAVLDWSFMLSFSATAGIVGIAPYINKLSSRIKSKIRLAPLRYAVISLTSTSLISVAATLACLPVTVFIVGELSLVFLPANLLTVVAVPVALVTALMSVPPLGIVSEFTAGICTLVCRFVSFVAEKLSDLPYSSVSADSHFIKLSLIAVGAVVLLSYIFIKEKKSFAKVCCIVASAAVIVNSAFSFYTGAGRVEIYCEDGNVVVSDGKRAVALCMSKNALYSITDALDKFCSVSVTLVYPRYDSQVDINAAQEFTDTYNTERVFAVTDNSLHLCCDEFTVAQDVTLELDSVKLTCRMGNNGGCLISSESGSAYYAFSKYSPLIEADFLICGKYYDKADKSDYSAVVTYWDDVTVYKNSGENIKYENYAYLSYNAWGKYSIEGG